MPSDQGGLGSALVGEKVAVNDKTFAVGRLLGEGMYFVCTVVYTVVASFWLFT